MWIAQLDLAGFGREVRELGQRLEKDQGQADQDHLHKLLFWSDMCAVVGVATMWMAPNPVSVIALSLWTHSRWTMIGHHCCHGGYNRTDETGRYSSRGFAVGSLWRRSMDWLDWMLPEAWSVEHNNLHHYRLGERSDPDLIEQNVEVWGKIAGGKAPKDALTILLMFIWKWYYYAPNTYKELKVAEYRKAGRPLPEGMDPHTAATLLNTFTSWIKGTGVVDPWELMTQVVGPYFLLHFVVLPLPLALLSPDFFWNAVTNLVIADVLSNFHDFVVIATNHAGEDLYRFERGCKPKSPTFYLRAVTSSANFATGGDLNDFMHGWLNYQIEHHVWPDLSMLSYQKAQPQLQAICERYGVPYVQEDVFTRLRKTYDIFTSRASMRRYPDELEREEDMMLWAADREAGATPRRAAAEVARVVVAA
mmetsp:Transcript_86385/g.225341  ORF Transcript_86385/g.225341 Transcript_86385/m.225341 type:complete len:420 (+) Transcript_86385:29-1288(+)